MQTSRIPQPGSACCTAERGQRSTPVAASIGMGSLSCLSVGRQVTGVLCRRVAAPNKIGVGAWSLSLGSRRPGAGGCKLGSAGVVLDSWGCCGVAGNCQQQAKVETGQQPGHGGWWLDVAPGRRRRARGMTGPLTKAGGSPRQNAGRSLASWKLVLARVSLGAEE